MTCPICKNGKTIEGYTTLIFKKGPSTIVIKNVPANVCDNCDEAYLSEKVSRKAMNMADMGVNRGVEIEIVNFAA